MLELGPYEEQGHRLVGNLAAKIADALITVGPRARIIAETAKAAGLDAKVIAQFDDSQQALTYLNNLLAKGDVVLVKGSRAVQMEKIVPELEARQ